MGLCAIYGSMDYLLFNMQLSKSVYGDIWIFGSTFFGPVMFMHQLSRQFDFAKEECQPPKGVYFIANYIVVPLVLIYVWVLYAYLAKIIVTMELPKGNLAYMVTGFGSLGVTARLAVFPMRENGTKLLQQFYKYFFPILVVPIILLATGLYTRLSQYGVTEDRYAIGVSLVWLTGLAAWNMARPRLAHIKHVPMALAFLFIIASVGPWGAVSVSTHSQVARLEELLHKAGVIHDDGTMAKTTQQVPFEVRRDISGILEYAMDNKRRYIEQWISPFYPEIERVWKGQMNMTGDAKFEIPKCPERGFSSCWQDRELPRHVMEAWGMQYVYPRAERDNTYGEYKNFNTSYGQSYGNNTIIKVAPYTYALWVSPANGSGAGGAWYVDHVLQEPGKDPVKLKVSLSDSKVLTVDLGGRKASFPLQPLADELLKANVQNIPDSMLDKMTLHPSGGGDFSAELHVAELHGYAQQDVFKPDGGTMLLLFTP
jgi:hypothetical protein